MNRWYCFIKDLLKSLEDMQEETMLRMEGLADNKERLDYLNAYKINLLLE